ncbi:hypothetical protein EBZ35_04445 [bacterium]|nr:hypothetical protein [bacterium]
MTQTPSSEYFKKKSKRLKSRLDQLNSADLIQRQAIAVQYNPSKDKAPKVVAVGKGRVAQKILDLAEEYRIPFYEDSGLTDLLGKLTIQSEIPPHLYKLVAEVLVFVFQLNQSRKKKSPLS